MAARGPQLELGVAAGADLEQPVLAAIVEIDAGDRLGVAAIEALGQPHNRRQRPDRAAPPARQIPVPFVAPLRRRLTVVAGDQGDRLDLFGIEAAQIAILDQIVRMTMMALVADVHADVVQERRVLEPFALAIGEAVNGARLIEERRREPRDLCGVLGPVVAPLGELDHAAAPDVWVAIGLRDVLPVTGDVVENQPFTKGEVAQRQVGRVEAADDRVEQNRARHGEVGAPRLETRDRETVLEVERHELLAQAVQLLGGDSPIPERRIGRSAIGRDGDRTEAEDRPGRADDAIESCPCNLVEILADFAFDVADELAFVARLDRIGLDVALGQADDADFETFSELDVRTGAARHLDAAASDIDDARDLAGDADAIRRRHMDQSRFFGA
jgi:hypothetical protein